MNMTWRSDTADFISMLLLIKLMEINFGSHSTNVFISLFELSFPLLMVNVPRSRI